MKKQILSIVSILLLAVSIVSAQTPTKTIAGGVLNGKATNLAIPAYPAAAKALNAGGAVNVKVVIDENGEVISAEAVSGHPLLRQSAEKAARESKFSPTSLSGQAVKVSGVIVYNFNPSNSADSAQTPIDDAKIISGGVVNSKASNLARPTYLAAARAVRASGAVNVQVTIDENGDVILASAVSGHPLLRQAAEQAARASKFSPTLLQGQPVKVTGIIVYNFVLPENADWEFFGRLISIAENDKATSYDISRIENITKENFKQEFADIDKLKDFSNLGSGERKMVLSNLTGFVEAKLNNKAKEVWYFKFGLVKGKIQSSTDTYAVRNYLFIVRELVAITPPDIPKHQIENAKKLAEFVNKTNINGEDVEEINKLLNTILWLD